MLCSLINMSCFFLFILSESKHNKQLIWIFSPILPPYCNPKRFLSSQRHKTVFFTDVDSIYLQHQCGKFVLSNVFNAV